MAKKKILIVDDNQDILITLNLRLKASNYDTVYAQDAITAVSAARKENPDLIILDIGLPGGDGFLVMERLKNLASTATLPVIVVSARDPSAIRDRALRAGAVAFFRKPPDNEELLSTIKNALGELHEQTGQGGKAKG